MTGHGRGANVARRNAGVYSRKHGQRRVLLWVAAVAARRCQLSAALVCGGCRTSVPRPVCFLFFSRSRARNSCGARGGGVSGRRPRRSRHGGRERGNARQAGEHFSGGVERAREPLARYRNDCEDGIPPGKIPGGDARTGFGGKRTKRVHADDGSRRNGVQADCRADRAAGSVLEEGRRKGGSRRAHWAGTIRLPGGCVGPERSGDLGASGGERERGVQRARPVARKTQAGQIGCIEYGADGRKSSHDGEAIITMGEPEQHEIPFRERRIKNARLRRGIFILPSLFTVANLLCGYYAVVASLLGGRAKFDHAAKAICFAILFDSLDGRVAGMTGTP